MAPTHSPVRPPLRPFVTLLNTRPDVIIEECTVNFKAWVLRHVFVILSGGKYTMQLRKLSPEDLGFPVSRPRQYVIFTRVDRLKLLSPL